MKLPLEKEVGELKKNDNKEVNQYEIYPLKSYKLEVNRYSMFNKE